MRGRPGWCSSRPTPTSSPHARIAAQPLAPAGTTAAHPRASASLRRGPSPGELAFVFTGAAARLPGHGPRPRARRSRARRRRRRARAIAARRGGLALRGTATRPPPHAARAALGLVLPLPAPRRVDRGTARPSPHGDHRLLLGRDRTRCSRSGAWSDLDAIPRRVARRAVFDREWLCGEFALPARGVGVARRRGASWSTWRCPGARRATCAPRSPASRWRTSLIVNTPEDDVIVGGEPRPARAWPRGSAAARDPPLGYDFVAALPGGERVSKRDWRALHHAAPRRAVPGVRFYTHATLASYAADSDASPTRSRARRMNPVDFPALVERAWADGVRVFVEHGPQRAVHRRGSARSSATGSTSPSRSTCRGARRCARWWTPSPACSPPGVPMQLEALRARLARSRRRVAATRWRGGRASARRASAVAARPSAARAAHAACRVGDRAGAAPPSDVENGESMAPAPLPCRHRRPSRPGSPDTHHGGGPAAGLAIGPCWLRRSARCRRRSPTPAMRSITSPPIMAASVSCTVTFLRQQIGVSGSSPS